MDIVYQVDLEILYCIIPSLSHNTQNSLQEGSGQVLYLTARKVSNSSCEWLSVDCNLEGLYLDSEYGSRKTIKFCVGLYK
jgi:hypothetical protein